MLTLQKPCERQEEGPDDLGQLWEYYVLNELTAQLQTAGGVTSKVTKWT